MRGLLLLLEYALALGIFIAVLYGCSLIGDRIREDFIARHGFPEGYRRYRRMVFALGVGLVGVLPAAAFVLALLFGLHSHLTR